MHAHTLQQQTQHLTLLTYQYNNKVVRTRSARPEMVWSGGWSGRLIVCLMMDESAVAASTLFVRAAPLCLCVSLVLSPAESLFLAHRLWKVNCKTCYMIDLAMIWNIILWMCLPPPPLYIHTHAWLSHKFYPAKELNNNKKQVLNFFWSVLRLRVRVPLC